MSGPTAEQLAAYRASFNSFDKNRDGRISAKELGAVMAALGETPSKKELKELIKSVDGDGSGKIDFTEFVRMMESRANLRIRDPELEQMFRAFDKNNDGLITLDELRVAMDNMGEEISESELKKMIRQADENRDGCIDFSEFKRLVKSMGM